MFKINKDFIAGTVLGFGAGVATTHLKGESFRDASKNAAKWAFDTFESVKENLARLKETAEDIAAEAKAETKVARKSKISVTK